MAVMVALLRGINVGGRARLAMADLRRIAEGCGLDDVRTYIQSGNVVFRSEEEDTDALADWLRRAIAAAADVDPEVLTRSRDELAAVVDGNPYAELAADPTHLHVLFTVGEASLGSLDVPAYAPEEAVAVGRHVYLHLPGGMGRSKLAVDLPRQQGPTGTMRNWRTVTKLLALTDELQG
jgi:uncharacterized protein (DUF1697 family)